MTEQQRWSCIEEYLSQVQHKQELTIEPEPPELVDQDWKEGFE